jgi:LacI family transcriptional regulator
MGTTRRRTIYDVARCAGGSIASLSRVLNGQGSPRPEARDCGLRAVRDLRFLPSAAAQGLSNRARTRSEVFRRPNRRTGV